MRENIRHLPNKPLVEAILEVKWALAEGVDPAHPLFTGALAGIVSNVYPHRQKLPAADVPDELTGHVVKFRLRTADNKWPLIQAGPGIVTLNSIEEYSWELFRGRAVQLWESLQSAYTPFNNEQPPPVDALTLKYINAEPLGQLSPQDFITSMLNTQVALPERVVQHEVANSSTNAGVNVTYPLRRTGTTASIRLQDGQRNGVRSMTWTLTADGKFVDSVDQSGFAEWIDYAHGVLEEWFFALIDGTLVEGYR